jgi:hypothetical protein
MSDDMAFVTLLVDGDVTVMRIGEQTMRIPTTSVHFNGGKLMLEVEGNLAATVPAGDVAIIASHPAPTVASVAQAVDALDPKIVDLLLTQEAGLGSLDDPMGLVAMRAVCRAIVGDLPPERDPLETL